MKHLRQLSNAELWSAMHRVAIATTPEKHALSLALHKESWRRSSRGEDRRGKYARRRIDRQIRYVRGMCDTFDRLRAEERREAAVAGPLVAALKEMKCLISLDAEGLLSTPAIRLAAWRATIDTFEAVVVDLPDSRSIEEYRELARGGRKIVDTIAGGQETRRAFDRLNARGGMA